MRPLEDIEADWPRISGLLDKLMELPPVSRETYITALPPPDDRLADTLRELLALQAEVETEDFMDDLPVFPGVTDPAEVGAVGAARGVAGAGGLAVGAEVGPYRLLRPIGEGGMGAVWLAERADGSLKRKVALKLPRLAWAQDLAARMARERDILAGLEHPNIARLYDAGLDAQGRPWLALEFVEGRDLTAYCDAERLGLRARVRLFMQVLDAVQYAHASLVIHRDIKPANILVTPRGEARLLDFGIARLEEGTADAGPDLTRTGVSAMTPRYASPEQVQGARLTVASDLYSLGVVLHELLTGETPYLLRRASRAELEQAILDADLRVPSRLKVGAEAAAARTTTPERIGRDLRGDLDAVLLRALARAPAARYASAAAFRDDLERWLEGRPVAALPPSRLHTLRKFVARNRLAVGASAAAALALVAVSVVAVVQAQRATREATTATRAKDFLIQIYGEADPLKSDTKDPNARALLERAESDLGTRFADEPALQAEVMQTLQQAWANLGDPTRSRIINERRARLLRSLGRPADAAEASLTAAEQAVMRNDFAEAEDNLALLDDDLRIVRSSPAMHVRFHYLRGVLFSERGESDGAMSAFDESIAVARRGIAAGGRLHLQLFNALLSRAFDSRLRRGVETLRRDLAEAQGLVALLTPEQVRAVKPHLQLAVAYHRIGDHPGGWIEIQRAVAAAERDFGVDNALNWRERRYWLRFCVELGRPMEAVEWLRDAPTTIGVAALREYERNLGWLLEVAGVHGEVGDHEAFARQIAKAHELSGSSQDVGRPGYGTGEAQIRLVEARFLLLRGYPDRARSLLQGGGGAERSAGHVDNRRYMRLWVLGNADRASRDMRSSLKRLEAAEEEAIKRLGESHREVARIRMDLALTLAADADGSTDARVAAMVRSAVPVIKAAYPDGHRFSKILDGLALATGDPAAEPDAALRRSIARLAASGPVFFI